MTQYELYHHGVLGMHWGIRRYQPYPKGHKGGKEVGEAAKSRSTKKGERINRRAEKKLTKTNKVVEKKQAKATKQYQKAIKKSNSLLSTQKGIDKAMQKAGKAQRKVNRLELKGKKYYTRASKKLSKLGVEENSKVKELGQKYIDSINTTSKAMYVSAMTGGTLNRKRR